MSNNNDIYINSDSDNDKYNDKNQYKKKEINDKKKSFKKMTENEIKEYLKESISIPKNDWN
jgi:hypothetical protein